MEHSELASNVRQDKLTSEHQDTDRPLSAAAENVRSVRNGDWYAIYAMAKHEQFVCSILFSKGYETYSPAYRSRRQWSDRLKELEVPLFPGYVFCRFDPTDRRVPVLSTPGVLRIVGVGRMPIPIREEELAAIRAVIKSGCVVEPWPYLRVGCPVRIERGALVGVEGIVLSADKKSRLIVSVHLLQRSVAVEMDRDWIGPVTQRHDHSHAAWGHGNR